MGPVGGLAITPGGNPNGGLTFGGTGLTTTNPFGGNTGINPGATPSTGGRSWWDATLPRVGQVVDIAGNIFDIFRGQDDPAVPGATGQWPGGGTYPQGQYPQGQYPPGQAQAGVPWSLLAVGAVGVVAVAALASKKKKRR